MTNLSTSFGDTLREFAATEGDPVRRDLLLTYAGQVELTMSKLLNNAAIGILDLEHSIEKLNIEGQKRHQESMAAISKLIAYEKQMPAEERARLRVIIYATEAEIRVITELIADLRARVATLEALVELGTQEKHVNGD